MTKPYVNGEVLSGNEKSRARSIVAAALRGGKLLRPTFCEECGTGPCETEAHHHDYDQPLDVHWLCKRCHVGRHRTANEQIANIPRKKLTADTLRDELAALGLTQTAAAKRWGLPIRTLQHWCSGTRAIPPLLPTVIALESGAVQPLQATRDQGNG